MTKDEITVWALANGWQMIDGFPSLTKPDGPALQAAIEKAIASQP